MDHTHRSIDKADNRRRMQNGELYFAFTPDLVADRRRCNRAMAKYAAAYSQGDAVTRRTLVEMWKE
jgi:hypothetical protein